MVKIYVDVTYLLKQTSITGIQRVVIEYTLRLLKKPEYDVCLFSTASDGKRLYIVSNCAFFESYSYQSKDKRRLITRENFQISDMKKDEIYLELDCTWGSPLKRNVFFDQLKRQGVIIVSFIHDILPIMVPQFIMHETSDKFIPYLIAHLSYSDMIVCSTEFTIKQIRELSQRYGIPETSYGIATLGADFQVDPKNEMMRVQEEAKRITEAGTRYILTVGTLEPRKNHQVLLEAYNQGLKELGVQLVFVGRTGWMIDDLMRKIYNHPDYNRSIFHLEGMNDASVAWLYDHAYLVAYPTQLEGFGIPAVEALEHHVPTILSDIPVMHEVGKGYCDYFDQNNPSAFVDAVRKYVESPDYYAERKANIEHYRPTTWDESTDMLVTCINQAAARGSQPAAAQHIDVTEIVQQIKDLCADELAHNDVETMQDLAFDLRLKVMRTMQIHYDRPLTSRHQAFSRLVISVKRVIRKLLRFLGEPTVDEINAYHQNIMNILGIQNLVNQMVYDLQAQVKQLSEENAEMRQQLEMLMAEKECEEQ